MGAGGDWFYLEGGQQQGPVTLEALAGLLQGQLPADTLVWRDGLADWAKAGDVPELQARLRPAPPTVPVRPPSLPSAPRTAPSSGAPAAGGGYAQPRSPAAARPAPRPAYGAAGTAAAPGFDEEPATYNPFVLWRRAFQFGGRFDRGEFAISYLGGIAFFYAVILAMGLGLGVTSGGEPNQTGAMVLGAVMLLLLPVMMIIGIGSMVRRLRDIDKSPWLVLLMLVPCVGFILMIYLLVAPGVAGAGTTSGGGGISPVLVIVIALVALVPILGIVAAIAIPSLLRARVSANEAATIGDTRSLISAQAAYQASNGGFYEGRLECLAEPAQCMPNYTGPSFLSPDLMAATKSGYVRELVTGPPAAGLPPGLSPSSVASFAFVARPVTEGQTGVRSFCGDSSGRVCSFTSAQGDPVDRSSGEVACSMSCMDLY